MARTILDVLQRENPSLDTTHLKQGGNTTNEAWVRPDGWQRWKELSFQKLSLIYDRVIHLKWEGATAPEPELSYDKEIRDERTFESYLDKYMIPDVNKALERATRHMGWAAAPYLARGSWTGNADWGLVSHNHMFESQDGRSYYTCLLPGDTKLSTKWHPSMERSKEGWVREQWQLPVAQVQGYAKDADCRYGFILSDAHLVILRFSPKPVSTVNVNTRPRPEVNNQRIASDSTNTSSRFASMSIDSPSEYVDSVAGLEYNNPDYVAIPWTAWGKGNLTIRLGLFFICLMAGTGNATVDFTYPELDSWMRLNNGKFMHNTSGDVASKLPRGGRLIEPEDDGADDGGEAPSPGSPQHSEAGPSQSQHSEAGPSQSQHSEAGPSQFQHTGAGPSQAPDGQHDRHIQHGKEVGEGGEDSEGEGDLPAPPGTKVKLKYDGTRFVFDHNGKQFKTDETVWVSKRTNQGTVYVCDSKMGVYWTRKWPTSITKKSK